MDNEKELKDLTDRVIAAGGRAGKKSGTFLFDYAESQGYKRGDEHREIEGLFFWKRYKREGASQWMGEENLASEREKVAKDGKDWREENPDRAAEHQRNYYLKNKPKIALKNKKWRERNPSEASSLARANYLKNRSAVLDRQKEYRANNRDKTSAKSARRRVAMLGAMDPTANRAIIDSRYTAAQYLREVTGYKWEVDHTQPISKGGLHNEGNLQVVPFEFNRGKSNASNNRWFEDSERYEFATEVEKEFEREAIAAQRGSE